MLPETYFQGQILTMYHACVPVQLLYAPVRLQPADPLGSQLAPPPRPFSLALHDPQSRFDPRPGRDQSREPGREQDYTVQEGPARCGTVGIFGAGERGHEVGGVGGESAAAATTAAAAEEEIVGPTLIEVDVLLRALVLSYKGRE